MANNLTNSAENLVGDWLHGVGSPTRPTTPLKGALYTTLPNQETGSGGTEVSGNGYSRQNVAVGAMSGGATSNTSAITFTASGGNWGTIVGIGIWDSAGTPLLIWVIPLAANKTIDDGDSLVFAIGDLDLGID